MFRFNIQTAIVLLAFVTAPDAWAKRLYEIDGIELRGGARIVTYGAATCNVKEGSHSAAEYERIKDNDGQPLDVWQLDFSVYNGSGKWLDHLVARYGIESKWPDCTSWDGPTGTYSEPLQWADTIGIIQESGRNVVAPGATLTDSAFILVFHQDQPHFSNWSVDFRFRDAPPEEPGNADRPTIVPEAQEQPFQIDAQQMCDSKPKGSACWEKLTNISECYTWIPQSRPNYQIVTWTGDCSEGLAQGVGTWKMQSLYPTVEGTGLLQKGKKQGHWVERSLRQRGAVEAGPYVKDKRQGHWVERDMHGSVEEGPYVNDKRHGRWIVRGDTPGRSKGRMVKFRYEGPYVEGKKHGRWVYRKGEKVSEGLWENGKRVDLGGRPQ